MIVYLCTIFYRESWGVEEIFDSYDKAEYFKYIYDISDEIYEIFIEEWEVG
jgi:hypothetical protein